jgi:hypothetical protein
MSYGYVVNDLLNNNSDKDMYSNSNINLNNLFNIDIESIISFIIDNYKQILLLILVFIIIYVVDHITYYNALFYGLSTAQGLQQPQAQGQGLPQQINSSNFKKKSRKIKK